MKKRLYLGLECALDLSDWLHFPVIKIVPREIHTALKLESYTHLIFTSKTAVKILNEKTRIPKECTIISVGSKTSAALESLNIICHYTAKEETAEGIVDLLETMDLKKAHVFWPHSALSRSLLTDYFEKKDILCTDCVLYDTVLHNPGPLPNLQNIEEILFTSPSTVDNFLILCPKIPPHIKLTAIGPVTRQHLEAKGLIDNCGLF